MGIKNPNKVLYGVLALLLITTFAFALSPQFLGVPQSESTYSDVGYKGIVCTYVDRIDGTREDLGCTSNLLVNAGANAVRDQLGGQVDFNNFSAIGLCNATAGCTGADAADTTLDNEYTDSGLARTYGTYSQLSGVGNWSIYNTFTASEDNLETNQTALFNQSSGGTMLAENTFTLVTLQTNDQLTINWTITASDGGA